MTAPAASAVMSLPCAEGDAHGRGRQRRRVVDAVAQKQRVGASVVSSRTSASFCSGLWLAWTSRDADLLRQVAHLGLAVARHEHDAVEAVPRPEVLDERGRRPRAARRGNATSPRSDRRSGRRTPGRRRARGSCDAAPGCCASRLGAARHADRAPVDHAAQSFARALAHLARLEQRESARARGVDDGRRRAGGASSARGSPPAPAPRRVRSRARRPPRSAAAARR